MRVVQQENSEVTKAIVYVPQGKEGVFVKKINDYSNPQKDTEKGNPKNANLVDSIEDVKLAMLESFWPTTERNQIPTEQSSWCEAWIRIDENEDYEAKLPSFLETLTNR